MSQHDSAELDNALSAGASSGNHGFFAFCYSSRDSLFAAAASVIPLFLRR